VDECKALGGGDGQLPERRLQLLHHHAHGLPGRAVQVDPIKPTLKASGTKRSTLKSAEPLSSVGFKINLRRYSLRLFRDAAFETRDYGFDKVKAGAHTPPLFSST